MGAPGTAVVLLLALVLAWAAIAKLSESIRPLPLGELAVAASAALAPGRVAAAMLAAVFAGFTAVHVRQWRVGQADCDCFGGRTGAGASPGRRGAMTALSTAAALAVAAAGAPSLTGLYSADPGALPAVMLAAGAGAAAWRLAFTLRPRSADGAADALVRDSALMLERRLSRRTLLQQIALVGSALAVAPLRYLLYPGTALAVIAPGIAPAAGAPTDTPPSAARSTRAQQLPARDLRGGLVDVHRLRGPASSAPSGASATTSIATRCQDRSSPGAAGAPAAPATTSASPATSFATGSATRTFPASPQSSAGWSCARTPARFRG